LAVTGIVDDLLPAIDCVKQSLLRSFCVKTAAIDLIDTEGFPE